MGSVISRYSRPAMSQIWSDGEKLRRWLDVELAALEGWAEVGAVPRKAVAAIRERAIACHLSQASPFDGLPPALRHRLLTTDHVVEVISTARVEHLDPTTNHLTLTGDHS